MSGNIAWNFTFLHSGFLQDRSIDSDIKNVLFTLVACRFPEVLNITEFAAGLQKLRSAEILRYDGTLRWLITAKVPRHAGLKWRVRFAVVCCRIRLTACYHMLTAVCKAVKGGGLLHQVQQGVPVLEILLDWIIQFCPQTFMKIVCKYGQNCLQISHLAGIVVPSITGFLQAWCSGRTDPECWGGERLPGTGDRRPRHPGQGQRRHCRHPPGGDRGELGGQGHQEEEGSTTRLHQQQVSRGYF